MQRILEELLEQTMSHTSKIMTTMVEHSTTRLQWSKEIETISQDDYQIKETNFSTNQQQDTRKTRKRKSTLVKSPLQECNNIERALQ